MIKPSVKTNINLPWGKLHEMLGVAAESYVTVGVHDDAGTYPDGTPVAAVAAFNEFGTKTAPERSFFRSTIAEKERELNELRENLVSQLLDGKITVEKALETIGFRMQIWVQNKIKSNVPPPNAKSTQRKKALAGVLPKTDKDGKRVGLDVSLGRSNTLINTGLLLRSIGYKVFLK